MGTPRGAWNWCAWTTLPKMEVSRKGKRARGVGWSPRAQEGVPEHQKEVGWVAQKLIGEGVEWYQIEKRREVR